MSAPIYSERPDQGRAPEQSRGVIRTLALVSVLVAGASLLTSLQYGTRGAARFVNLAPARIGQPGYWRHLDQDSDGVSCER